MKGLGHMSLLFTYRIHVNSLETVSHVLLGLHYNILNRSLLKETEVNSKVLAATVVKNS